MFVCHIQCQSQSTTCQGCGSTVVFEGNPPSALVDTGTPLSARAKERIRELLPPGCDNLDFDGCTVWVAHSDSLDEAVAFLYADLLGTRLSQDALPWVRIIVQCEGQVPDSVRRALQGTAQQDTLAEAIAGCQELRAQPGQALVL